MSNALAFGHLELRLRALHRACRVAAVEQQRRAAAEDGASIADEEMAALLARVEERISAPLNEQPLMEMTSEERDREAEYHRAAAASSVRLPLEELAERLGLGEVDLAALLVVAAPELDRAYERIYAYLADEPVRRYPSVETVLLLTRGFLPHPAHRVAVGPHGALRSTGLVVSNDHAPTDLRQELRLGAGVLEFLLGEDIPLPLIMRREVQREPAARAVGSEPYQVDELAVALLNGLTDTVGLAGPSDAVELDAALAIAHSAGRAVRVQTSNGLDPNAAELALRDAALDAAVSGALLVIVLPTPPEDGRSADHTPLGHLLEDTRFPVVLAGVRNWRPSRSLRDRRYLECKVTGPDAGQREVVLDAVIDDPLVVDTGTLARRWRLSEDELRAAAGSARAMVALRAETRVTTKDVDTACSGISAISSGSLITAVAPRRGPETLVLPPELHDQVIEIADFARLLDIVHDRWGFDRVWGGGPGFKVLFHGDPGTGKTLAAEVIARVLAVQLLKIDLSRVVSKWVGDTAKNLDLVFQEARSTNAVLFFDEADALLGKRGEVRHGVDRYANSEVSHLLQLLERHEGLVVLATNLRQNLDPAFTRRFHRVVHFPRPGPPERARLWRLAFPSGAPLDAKIDLGVLDSLDLTGSGIVSAARTACLLAADRPGSVVSVDDVLTGIARQFQTEGRLLAPAELLRHRRSLEGG